MNVLHNYKWLQRLIGLNPHGGFENVILRFFYSILFITILLALWFFLIFNIHDDIYRLWAAIPSILSITPVAATYWHMLINRERFHSLLDGLQDIVNERAKKLEDELIYLKAEQRSSFATINFIYPSIVGLVTSSFPFIVVAYHWFSGEYTIDSWILFIPAWTPFELNTTARHLLIASHEVLCIWCWLSVVSTITSMLIGIVIYLEVFHSDVKYLFGQIDRLSARKTYTSLERNDSDLSERENLDLLLLERCRDAVDLHRKVNRFMHNLSDLLNFIILMMITPLAICESSSLFLIVKHSGSNFSYDMVMPIAGSFAPLIVLALLFYLGQKFHTISTEFTDIIYHTQWYQYPRRIQRSVLLMIMRSQQPFNISAYGIMRLNLENFVGLLKSMYSGLTVMSSVN